MGQVNPYASIEKRTFAAAVVHLLETEYGFLGGRRVMQLLAEDIQQLVDEFYPASQRAGSGSLIWTCTADEGQKAEVGKRTEEYKTVTVVLPLVAKEDLAARTQGTAGRAGRAAATRAREKRQLARVVKAAHAQGGLLTLAELSVILNHGYGQTQRYVREWEAETGELLPLKGYHMDQGSRPTHKGPIIRLFEQGKEPPDIARETGHALKSVERYLKDYERVRLLLAQGVAVEQLSPLVGRGPQVVLEYVEIAREYHPELFADQADKPS
jgi:hypothetical protein